MHVTAGQGAKGPALEHRGSESNNHWRSEPMYHISPTEIEEGQKYDAKILTLLRYDMVLNSCEQIAVVKQQNVQQLKLFYFHLQ